MRWIALFVSLMVGLPAAAVAPQVSRMRATKPKQLAKKPESRFSLGLAYSSVTNMNDSSEGKLLTHSLGVEAGWALTPKIVASLTVGGTYQSISNEIIQEDKSFMTDTYLGLAGKLKLADRHALDIQAGVFMPTSEDSQYEGHRGRYIGLLRTRSKFASWYALSNKLSGQYIANSYNYSPTTDELNKQSLADYGLDNVFTAGNFFLSIGAGARITTYIDGMSELSYFNISKIGYRGEKLSGVLAYMNGSYRDDQTLQPLFFDRYKKLFELALVYAF